jgi:hypothetical protein
LSSQDFFDRRLIIRHGSTVYRAEEDNDVTRPFFDERRQKCGHGFRQLALLARDKRAKLLSSESRADFDDDINAFGLGRLWDDRRRIKPLEQHAENEALLGSHSRNANQSICVKPSKHTNSGAASDLEIKAFLSEAWIFA